MSEQYTKLTEEQRRLLFLGLMTCDLRDAITALDRAVAHEKLAGDTHYLPLILELGDRIHVIKGHVESTT